MTHNTSPRIGIVYSDFYKEEMQEMLTYAHEALLENGTEPEQVTEYPVSGSFEIPLIGAQLARTAAADALIGLGIIVEGETHHARLVAENSARAMMDIQVEYGIPFVFEVLYVDSMELAHVRLSKGRDAALCALHSLAQLRKLQS